MPESYQVDVLTTNEAKRHA